MSYERDAGVKRIKAPNLDTSALIKQNECSLIGRLTNPLEQKMSALLPALPREWNLTGTITGSDLGNNCFLYRFEREEDLHRVLDNRPYHFAFWMVILQKWEPIISATFPSMIPFWITIKGLPLHYWQEIMVRNIGQELGTLIKHELTRTTARVRVSIDGLKPLIKESIVEFDSGEEITITLEYEKLKLHCSNCNSLLHAKKNCPDTVKEYTENALNRYSRTTENWSQGGEFKSSSGSHYRGRGTYRQSSASQTVTQKPYLENQGEKEKDETYKVFQQRIDRHGKPFGERTSTKQTRNAPPMGPPKAQDQTWKKKEKTTYDQDHISPPYYRKRETRQETSVKGRDLFSLQSKGEDGAPSQNTSQWRPRLVRAPEEFQPKRPSPERAQSQEVEVLDKPPTEGTSITLPTQETVMAELQEATRQYLSHPDPVEAAARRQRVHCGDANGQTEEVAAFMLATAEERYHLTTQRCLMDVDPVTPPPLQLQYTESWMQPDPNLDKSPPNSKEMDFGIDTVSNNDRGTGTPARPAIRSIIISPNQEMNEVGETQQLAPGMTEDNETLESYQKRIRKGSQKSMRNRSPRSTPNILKGASFKKRALSQIFSSPSAGGSHHSGRPSGARNKKDNTHKQTETTNSNQRKPEGEKRSQTAQAVQQTHLSI